MHTTAPKPSRVPGVLCVLFVLLGTAGCVTTSSGPASSAQEEGQSAIEAYRALTEQVRQNPDNSALVDRMIELGRRHVDEYIAGEAALPEFDLWGRRDYLRAYPRTGLVFDNDVDFLLRERERQVADIEAKIVKAGESDAVKEVMTLLAELSDYAPYSKQLAAIKGSAVNRLLAQARTLDVPRRLARVAALQQQDPLPDAARDEISRIVQDIVDQARLPDLRARMRRLAKIRKYARYFPEIKAFDEETRKAVAAAVEALTKKEMAFDAAALCVDGKRLWPKEDLFAQYTHRMFQADADHALQKAVEYEDAAGDARLATELVYALTAWRFVPSDPKAREKALGLAARFTDVYGVDVLLKDVRDRSDFTAQLRKHLGVYPVRLRLRSEMERSEANAVLAMTLGDISIKTDSKITKENSQYLSGTTYKPNPAYDEALNHYRKVTADYNAAQNADLSQDSNKKRLNDTWEALKNAETRLKDTPQYVEVPKYADYTYRKTVFTLTPMVSLTYTLTDASDGRKYKEGSYEKSREAQYVHITDANPNDSKGLRNQAVDINAERVALLEQFLAECALELAMRLREEALMVWVRAGSRSLDQGFTEDARDKLFAYKFMDAADKLAAFRGSGEMMCRTLGFPSVPGRLEKSVKNPVARKNFDERTFNWAYVVRETASYGKGIPLDYGSVVKLLEEWNPDVVEFKPAPEGSLTSKILNVFR